MRAYAIRPYFSLQTCNLQPITCKLVTNYSLLITVFKIIQQNPENKKSRQCPTLPQKICSTIGAGGLNYCVRDGNRCDPSAITTGKIIEMYKVCNGQALDLLVSVS